METWSDGYHILKFSSTERPKAAKKGEQIMLDLLDEHGEKVVLNGTVTWFEPTPGGYMMDVKTRIDEVPYKIEIFVGSNSSLDFVRLYRDKILPVMGPQRKNINVGLGES